MISYAAWQTRFGGDPDAVGKTVLLENVPFTVVGVAPPEFHGLEVGKQVGVWVPLEIEPRLRRPSLTSTAANSWLQLVGRLKPGVSFDQARAELGVMYGSAVIEQVAPLFRDPIAKAQTKSWYLSIERAGAGLSGTRRQFSKPLLVLMAIVGVLLLIACTNVANLLFVRALAREKEIALRLSLGAGRSRLIRQLLTESGLLAAAAAAVGLIAAHFLSQGLTNFLATARSPLVLDVSPDPAMLSFTAVIACCSVLLFGLLPAFRSTDMDFTSRLKGSGPGWGKSKSRRWSGGLIVVQVALLTVLILGAGLFLRSLHNLNSIDVGFDRSDILLVTVDTFGSGQSPEQLQALSAQLLDRLKTVPAVKTASLHMISPIGGGAVTLTFQINLPGGVTTVAGNVYVNRVAPDYFAALRTPIIAGRDFTRQDSSATAQVVIVNQAFADRYFGNANPIGQTITQNGRVKEIVGLVGDVKYMELRESMRPIVYEDVFQQPSVPTQFVIRIEKEPESVIAALRAEVKSVMGNVAITEKTLKEQIDSSIVRERLLTTLAALFGGLALVLAVIGLYGVVSNSIAQRVKEIGIRIALGVEPRDVISMVLREVFVLVGGGIVLGLPLAVFINRSVANLLYDLTPDDPLTVLASVAALLISGLTAGFLPARRASRVDAIVALRME